MQSGYEIGSSHCERGLGRLFAMDSGLLHELVRKILSFLPIFLIAVIMVRPAAGLGPRENRMVPKDGRIEMRDYGYRDWGPNLVHYRLPDVDFDADALKVIGPDGDPVAAQVDGRLLSFVASVPKGKTVTYRLSRGGGDPEHALTVKRAGNQIDVGNQYFRLRVPAEQKRNLSAPVSTDQVPVPMQQWRPAGGNWMGGMRFADPRKVASFQMKVLRSGPAWFDYEARYEFANGARYVCRISVSPRIPLARIREELDGTELRKHNRSFLMLDLHRGATPDTIQWVKKTGEKTVAASKHKFSQYMKNKKKAARKKSTSPRPDPTKPMETMFFLDNMVPGGKWGGEKGGLRVSKGDAGVGVIPLHVGSWRRAMTLNVWGDENGNATVGLPLDPRWVWWQYDRTDERSPFSTHEHDPELKKTYARREWGLYFGSSPAGVQRQYGHIGLNEYKNWIIDWETEEPVSYPRAFFTPEIVKQIKKHLSEHPDRSNLEQYYIISGRKKDAIRHAKRYSSRLGSDPWTVKAGLSHYRQSQRLIGVHLAEDALACPDLPEEMRKDIRRHLALWAYLMSTPDLNPRGAGVHLGNNNMTINRTIALVYFASLLPEHPEYDYWMDRIARYTRFKLATQTSVDGTWIGCPNYQLYGPTRFLDTAINVLHNTDTMDLRGAYHAR
ncbi:MAG: hypothetical protein KGZ25_13105, partial [Planctomycetes bacterium]|nr:hypothetical protein [Planctomycetota bacterium]